MARKIFSYREIDKRPSSAHKMENGSYENLYEVSLRGRKLKVTQAEREEIRDMERLLNDSASGTVRERRRWAKEFERDVLERVSLRQQQKLASFLSRMPSVVQGMLKARDSGYLNAYTSRYLDEIVNIIAQMDELEREQFYVEYGDLFADISDYYEMLRRYSYSPDKTFALTDADMERLHQKGYSSFESYKRDMEANIKHVRDILKSDYKEYFHNYKTGKFRFE